MPELPEHRLLGESALRPQVGDAQGFLLGQAGGHDLAEDAKHDRIGQRTLVALDHATQHLRFAVGAVVLGRRGGLALGRAHRLGQSGPFGDQRLDALVERIDPASDFVEVDLDLTRTVFRIPA